MLDYRLYKMMIVSVFICLIILTSQSVHSKVITVNSNNGNDSTECCVNGECACSSLFTALLNISNNTIINITSKSVALNNTTTMGSGKLTNITITGSNVTIMCNNSGSVYCESCDDVRIEGITWDRCGDPNGTNIAGVTFNGTSNISLVNCTFQHSQLPAVSLLEASYNVCIYGSKLLSNILKTHGKYHGMLSITRSEFEFTNSSNIAITIYESYFYNNTCEDSIIQPCAPVIINIEDKSVKSCNIFMIKTMFIFNSYIMFLHAKEVVDLINIQLTEVLAFNNNAFGITPAAVYLDLSSPSSNATLSIISSSFSNNIGGNVMCNIDNVNVVSVMINSSIFSHNKPPHVDFIQFATVQINLLKGQVSDSVILFHKVQFDNNLIAVPSSTLHQSFAGVVSIDGAAKIIMYMVNFTCNQHLGISGGALNILNYDSDHSVLIKECNFANNKSPGHGTAMHIVTSYSQYNIQISNTNFDQNVADSSVIYLQGIIEYGSIIDYGIWHYMPVILIDNSTFTSNVGSSMYLSSYTVKLSETVLFKNNTAENGGAMYLNNETTVTITDNATVKFIGNTATLNGGAIYVDLVCDHDIFNNYYYIPITFSSNGNNNGIFINNSANIVGNSLYFSVPKFTNLCPINTNISDSDSNLNVPCQFIYTQPVNGKMMNISCDPDYTLLSGTGAPIVTSPHELRLYFPFSDGYNISSTSDHNVYFITNNILGHPVKFTGGIFDYFGKPAEPVLFTIQLQSLQNADSVYTLIGGNQYHILTQSIDNHTILNVHFKGRRIGAYVNLTLILTSLFFSSNKINATLVVELVPCVDHPGYTYCEKSQTCVCYHANVKCSTDGNEIKRGYWFGSIGSKATTSLCPNHYCQFTNRKQTSEEYVELPNTINAQCNHHRVGRACGECSLGYTLSYDSTDCISVDQCGSGWTVLVITLTCLYWIVMIAGVFLCFMFPVSLGYLYGIVYYYSMISVLLGNNPYVSDNAFQFVSVLSSFAQLTPQFLGELCFVKGLSGIDQLFIHYSHAVAVSLLLLLIVVAARCSARITLYVSRCIIRVICLLILLSYTSIASTSLQLLRPLKFTDVKEWYTYSSPHIQYFHERHAVYGIVAVICELFSGIGLPLLLLLEPVLSRKINFIRIKPLLDQFQGCYKDKYRWFAAYYLICRQVIFFIVYIFNSNYYSMLFYLQTACVVITMIHICIQPYQSEFLNALDGIILLLIVLGININTFSFLKNVTTEIVLIIVTLPLILFSIIPIKSVLNFCLKKWRHHHYDPINDDDYYDDDNDERVANVLIRSTDPIDEMNESHDHKNYNTFDEPLLNFASNNDN